MSPYYVKVYVHGAQVGALKVCPDCGSTDITFPAYLNKVDWSGLTQPKGPINDEGLIQPAGIVRPPGGNPNPYFFTRPVPSGLQRDYITSTEFPNVGYTYYDDANMYTDNWYCNNCGSFFRYAALRASDLPSGASVGNTSRIIKPSGASQHDG